MFKLENILDSLCLEHLDKDIGVFVQLNFSPFLKQRVIPQLIILILTNSLRAQILLNPSGPSVFT